MNEEEVNQVIKDFDTIVWGQIKEISDLCNSVKSLAPLETSILILCSHVDNLIKAFVVQLDPKAKDKYLNHFEKCVHKAITKIRK